MDVKRAKELKFELANLIDQIDADNLSKFNKMSEELQNEIRVKVLAILNELDIRSGEIISFKRKSNQKKLRIINQKFLNFFF